VAVIAMAVTALAGCSGSSRTPNAAENGPHSTTSSGHPVASPSKSAIAGPQVAHQSTSPSAALPTGSPLKAGNPSGHASVPAAAKAVDTSHPDHVIGSGTPSGCTSAAVVNAVKAGGVITFRCGPNPITITMTATAKVVNKHTKLVLDGGGLVTLSGAGKRRILYMDTCDPKQGWTTSHCQDQSTPMMTVQNITFANGNSTGETYEGGGGGAIFDRGGRLKVVHSRFVGNRCDSTGPDLGGAAIRALSQYHNLPLYVVDSTFTGGVCSNGSGLSSIGVSWTVLNSSFTNNKAIGNGANPAKSGSPGGGSGAAIYNDGNTYDLVVDGCVMENNNANEGGGAIFYVSNDRTGTLTVRNSTLAHNRSGKFQNYPGIFYLGKGNPTFSHSSIKN
jgi:hypothetical protein